MRSSLRERLGPRVRIRAVSRSGSGSGGGYALEARRRAFETVTAVQALIRRGVSPSRAKAVVEDLAAGKKVFLHVPSADVKLASELARVGIDARRHQVPAAVDVAALRNRLGLTQEEFAVRFGLSVATVRNWEQQRSYPDQAARGYLTVIATDTEAAERAVEVGEEALMAR
jgi:DNA-binding transcriptional regulator YiaG